jgi:hypothetical protein
MTLSSLECEWVQYNFALDQGQSDDSHEISSFAGFMMAVKDPKTWLFVGILYCVSSFCSLLMATLLTLAL